MEGTTGRVHWTSVTTDPSTSCLSTIAPRSRRGCSASPPLTAEQTARVAASKQVVYDGLKLALTKGVPREAAGILVDEQFGAAILRDARTNGLINCAPAEKSGQDELQFEYGDRYAEHIADFKPTFVKVLVRYNPESDEGDEPPAGGAAARTGGLRAPERPAFHVRIAGADDARAVRPAGGRPAPL
jgi:myo-inositol catabolism protein IolC